MLSSKRKASNNKWKNNNPEKTYKYGRVSTWKRKGIKITFEKYMEIKEEQSYCCEICGTNEEGLDFKLCVDHNHSNGEIRGLLCNPCNKLLGNAKDNINILELAINIYRKRQKMFRNRFSLWTHIYLYICTYVQYLVYIVPSP